MGSEITRQFNQKRGLTICAKGDNAFCRGAACPGAGGSRVSGCRTLMLRHSSARAESDERRTETWMRIIALERENWECSGFKAPNSWDRALFNLRSDAGKTRTLKGEGCRTRQIQMSG